MFRWFHHIKINELIRQYSCICTALVLFYAMDFHSHQYQPPSKPLKLADARPCIGYGSISSPFFSLSCWPISNSPNVSMNNPTTKACRNNKWNKMLNEKRKKQFRKLYILKNNWKCSCLAFTKCCNQNIWITVFFCESNHRHHHHRRRRRRQDWHILTQTELELNSFTLDTICVDGNLASKCPPIPPIFSK